MAVNSHVILFKVTRDRFTDLAESCRFGVVVCFLLLLFLFVKISGVFDEEYTDFSSI